MGNFCLFLLGGVLLCMSSKIVTLFLEAGPLENPMDKTRDPNDERKPKSGIHLGDNNLERLS